MAPERMKPEGETTTWDGSYFATSKCDVGGHGGGGIDGTTCNATACAPPGKYIATMCATPDMSDAGGAVCSVTQQPVCVEVTFDYPSAMVVDGVISRQ
jgi:hypothetical protein